MTNNITNNIEQLQQQVEKYTKWESGIKYTGIALAAIALVAAIFVALITGGVAIPLAIAIPAVTLLSGTSFVGVRFFKGKKDAAEAQKQGLETKQTNEGVQHFVNLATTTEAAAKKAEEEGKYEDAIVHIDQAMQNLRQAAQAVRGKQASKAQTQLGLDYSSLSKKIGQLAIKKADLQLNHSQQEERRQDSHNFASRPRS